MANLNLSVIDHANQLTIFSNLLDQKLLYFVE